MTQAFRIFQTKEPLLVLAVEQFVALGLAHGHDRFARGGVVEHQGQHIAAFDFLQRLLGVHLRMRAGVAAHVQFPFALPC
jgi:hypothetical protein